jgi:hypothetical protein
MEEFGDVELTQELEKECNEIFERHFSRKINLTKDIENLSSNGILAMERIMKFAHSLGLSFSKDGVKEFTSTFEKILDSTKFEWTNKMIEKEAIDVKLGEDSSMKKNEKSKKAKKVKKEYTRDDCDAFGFHDLVKDFKKALSSKNTGQFID